MEPQHGKEASFVYLIIRFRKFLLNFLHDTFRFQPTLLYVVIIIKVIPLLIKKDIYVVYDKLNS